jgi:hypothetical protein
MPPPSARDITVGIAICNNKCHLSVLIEDNWSSRPQQRHSASSNSPAHVLGHASSVKQHRPHLHGTCHKIFAICNRTSLPSILFEDNWVVCNRRNVWYPQRGPLGSPTPSGNRPRHSRKTVARKVTTPSARDLPQKTAIQTNFLLLLKEDNWAPRKNTCLIHILNEDSWLNRSCSAQAHLPPSSPSRKTEPPPPARDLVRSFCDLQQNNLPASPKNIIGFFGTLFSYFSPAMIHTARAGSLLSR